MKKLLIVLAIVVMSWGVAGAGGFEPLYSLNGKEISEEEVLALFSKENQNRGYRWEYKFLPVLANDLTVYFKKIHKSGDWEPVNALIIPLFSSEKRENVCYIFLKRKVFNFDKEKNE